MKQDPDWIMVSTSYDTLTLYRLIEMTVLAQTEDQCPFTTLYDQELGFYLFKQDILSNPQWYERFNKKVYVGDVVGVTRQHKILLEYVAQELHNQALGDLAAAEQLLVRDDTKERCISYIRAGHNMATSTWICRTTSPQVKIFIPIIISRLCTYLISTARPWSPV
jgi:hypothetical protein